MLRYIVTFVRNNPDKICHFIVGFLIGLFLFPYIGIYGVLVGGGIGILKEIYDKLTHGKFDLMDFIYTFTGSFIGFLSGFYILMNL